MHALVEHQQGTAHVQARRREVDERAFVGVDNHDLGQALQVRIGRKG